MVVDLSESMADDGEQEHRSAHDGGIGTGYINAARGSETDTVTEHPNLRYRYCLKTVVNVLLERNTTHDQPPVPPLPAVKDSVGEMVSFPTILDGDDRLSLETFATTARHEVNLTVMHSQVLAALAQQSSERFEKNSNAGGGIHEGIQELQSTRARAGTPKVILLLTHGRASVGSSGSLSYSAGGSYAIQMATQAANAGMTIYAVGIGADADMGLLNEIVRIGHGSAFHAEGSIDQYREQLHEAFRALGENRPSVLIQ